MNTIYLLLQKTSTYSEEKMPVRAFLRLSRAEQTKSLIEKCNPRGTLEIVEVEYSTESAE